MSADLAPLLGARRDGTASADSARGLLMTVLGEFVLPAGGTAWTRSLIAVLEQLGVRDKTARQTIARTEGEWLAREKVGRETRWTLTSEAHALLATGAERIYGFGQGVRRWDGQWVVVLASVPDTDRARRYRMTQALNWAGFGSLGNGTWINPWTASEQQAVATLRDLDIDATSFVGTIGEIGSAPALARQAWDLPTLRQHYDDFLADTDHTLDTVDTDETDMMTASDTIERSLHTAGALAAVVHRWRRFPFLDPDLPGDLLDADWPGRAAAERFATIRATLLPAARDAWSELEAR